MGASKDGAPIKGNYSTKWDKRNQRKELEAVLGGKAHAGKGSRKAPKRTKKHRL